MRPASLPALVPPPLKWSLTNAVKQRRGDLCKTFLVLFFLSSVMALLTHPHVLNIYRYDYLEFTDSRGGKVRYDMKVGTEKWPKVGYG